MEFEVGPLVAELRQGLTAGRNASLRTNGESALGAIALAMARPLPNERDFRAVGERA